MRFAYADPPYPGCAHRYAEQKEVNHMALVGMLVMEFPDGWALSTASTTLRYVLQFCPEDVRIGAWVKPFASFKPGVNPAYAWEPVIFRGGRKRDRDELTVRDWIPCSITLERNLVGVKPKEFNYWVRDLLGVRGGIDELVDVFPGSGGMDKASLAASLDLRSLREEKPVK